MTQLWSLLIVTFLIHGNKMNYLEENKVFFVSLLIIVVIYYVSVFIYLYIKKGKNIKNFSKKILINKNFNIFDKNKNNSREVDITIENTKNDDWLNAFKELNEQSTKIENDIEIDNLLSDMNISSPDED